MGIFHWDTMAAQPFAATNEMYTLIQLYRDNFTSFPLGYATNLAMRPAWTAAQNIPGRAFVLIAPPLITKEPYGVSILLLSS